MRKTVPLLTLALVASLIVPGCGESKPPEPPPDQVKPAPPSAEKIRADLNQAIQPIVQTFQQDVQLGPEQIEPNMKALQTALGTYRGTENAPQAIKAVAGQLKDYVRQASREEKWWYVVFFFDAMKMLDPASAPDVQRLRDEAQLNIDRPKPEVTGFYTDETTGQTTIFLKVYLPAEGKTTSHQVRVGDEIHNLRVVEIIGNNRCVLFEYLVTKDEFQVCTKAARESL